MANRSPGANVTVAGRAWEAKSPTWVTSRFRVRALLPGAALRSRHLTAWKQGYDGNICELNSLAGMLGMRLNVNATSSPSTNPGSVPNMVTP